MEQNPQCQRCKFFYTTFDPDSPRGCRLFRFKTASIPSLVIKRESGKECEGFVIKPHLKKKGLDLNDPGLW